MDLSSRVGSGSALEVGPLGRIPYSMYQVSEAVLDHVGWDAAKEAATQQLLPPGCNAQDGWQEASWSWLKKTAVSEAALARRPL